MSALDGGSAIEVTYDGVSAGAAVKATKLDEATSVDISLGALMQAPVQVWTTSYDNVTLDLE